MCIRDRLESTARGYSKRVALFCLLHDSAESYIGDMTRPLQMQFQLFSEYEKKLQKVIFSKYATLDIDDDEKEDVYKRQALP